MLIDNGFTLRKKTTDLLGCQHKMILGRLALLDTGHVFPVPLRVFPCRWTMSFVQCRSRLPWRWWIPRLQAKWPICFFRWGEIPCRNTRRMFVGECFVCKCWMLIFAMNIANMFQSSLLKRVIVGCRKEWTSYLNLRKKQIHLVPKSGLLKGVVSGSFLNKES